MIINNYPDFRNKVQIVIDGDDISQSSISVQVLDLIISAGEQRIYRDVRSSVQDTALSVVLAGNLAALPTNCLEVRSVYFATWPALTYAPLEELQTLLQLGMSSNASHSRRYTIKGDNLLFWPPQSDGAVVLGQYYQRFADISTGLNAFILRFPDLFLYAALAESAPYIGEKDRLAEWKERYATIAQSANEFERRRATRGSKLSTRTA